MRRITLLVVAGLLVLGIGASASAQGQISAGYWPQDTEITFTAQGVPPQVVKSPVVVTSGAVTLLPRVTVWGQYATNREAEGAQDTSKFKVSGSQTLVYGSFELINESGLSLSPAVGYLTAGNKYTWGAGESSVTYMVGYSGMVVGGIASLQLAPGFGAQVTVLHGPGLTVTDTAPSRPADSYISALTDVTASVSVEIIRNLAVEVGYRGVSQLAKDGTSEVWERTSSGFFAAAKVQF